MTKLLAIMFMLIPCAAFADCMDTYTVNESPCKCLNSPIITITYSVGGETLCIINDGTLSITHGSCEKLGLKHAFITDDYGNYPPFTLIYIDPDISVCQNCGLVRKRVKIEPSYHYEYK